MGRQYDNPVVIPRSLTRAEKTWAGFHLMHQPGTGTRPIRVDRRLFAYSLTEART